MLCTCVETSFVNTHSHSGSHHVTNYLMS